MKISVIIPALNEEQALPGLLRHIRNHSGQYIHEVIVCDGGSSDKTQEVAEANGAKFIKSPRAGRAVQMNAGADAASGEVLYFLHADSYPPENFSELILEQIKNGYETGCFRMKWDSDHIVLRFFAWLTRFNSSWCRGGDQSLYVTTEKFIKAGKYRDDFLIYEDNEILKRLRKIAKFKVIQRNIVTSARRYRANGTVRLQATFLLIHFRHRVLGHDQERILKYYRKHVK